jgi:phosphatidylglycerophosphate synthase
MLLAGPGWSYAAALAVLAAWFCDRLDGQLARLQGTASRFGAWLDANVDELLEVAWHFGIASAAAATHGAAWLWLAAFLSGKYLFMHSLASEPQAGQRDAAAAGEADRGWLRRLYHLPGNADVRVHVLLLALVTGLFAAELIAVAAYYHFRWLARYALVARRWRTAT